MGDFGGVDVDDAGDVEYGVGGLPSKNLSAGGRAAATGGLSWGECV